MGRVRAWLRWLRPVREPATLTSRAAYDRWAAAYPPYAHNALMLAEETAMRDLLPDLARRVVLDLASGTGRYGMIAAEAGARLVVCLDDSAAMLAANRLKQRARAGMTTLPLPARSVDVVLCGLALGHTPHLDTALDEIARVLTPGGVALVSDFHPFLFLNGAQRTFTTADKTYAVEHYPHLYSDYHRAAGAAGLHIDAAAEPTLPQRAEPVVLVLRLIRRV